MKKINLILVVPAFLFLSFCKTSSPSEINYPKVSTLPITIISSNSAISGGKVESEGTSPVHARGVCWVTSVNPTIYNNKTIDGSGTGIFTSSITGLDGGTRYYIRAYASNSWCTTYGEQYSITTESGGSPPSPPSLLFPEHQASGISTAVTLEWNEGTDSAHYHLQVSISNIFVDNIFDHSVGNKTFQLISNLNNNSTYFWRVMATNNYGNSGWSLVRSFTTSAGGEGNAPCEGIPTVTYSGKIYNTVQIGNQCWLKENLDVGKMILWNKYQLNNGIIEKYCYNNDSNNCRDFGGLYQWNEAMQYITTKGAKGICPSGWHIPTYDEFKTLAANVYDDGNALKAIGQGAVSGIGINTSGFSALMSGYIDFWGYANPSIGMSSKFWSSTDFVGEFAKGFELYYVSSHIIFYNYPKIDALSIRCLKD